MLILDAKDVMKRDKQWRAFLVRVGKRVKLARTKAKLTQQQLADISGVSRQEVCYHENARHGAEMCTLWNYAQALEIDIHELVPHTTPTSKS